MNPQNFVQLCNTLAAVDMFGSSPPASPWAQAGAQMSDIQGAIEAARPVLPLVYADSYIDPLQKQLSGVMWAGNPLQETLVGAVAQHGSGYVLAPALKRFLAVVSNFYRSFLDKKKRAAANFPTTQTLPPLATFKFAGDFGPFTYPVDKVQQMIPASVGVVSMPATYAGNPILWAALAHETGGHDVVGADAGLLQELQQGVGKALANVTVANLSADELKTLWAYWMDEVVADVYGLLNIGPTFAHSITAFLAAFRNFPLGGGLTIPKVSMQSVSEFYSPLDVHPTDIVRLHLAIGTIETFAGLAPATRNAYIADIKQLADLCGSGSTVRLFGYASVDGGSSVTFNATVPLADLQESARQVGRYLATAKFAALDNHSIQEIETWDNADETRAQAVNAALAAGQPIGHLGDDAQLLAGATLRLLEAPGDYAAVTAALEAGLDQSFATDPIWSIPQAEHILMFQSPSMIPPDPPPAKPQAAPAKRRRKRTR